MKIKEYDPRPCYGFIKHLQDVWYPEGPFQDEHKIQLEKHFNKKFKTYHEALCYELPTIYL